MDLCIERSFALESRSLCKDINSSINFFFWLICFEEWAIIGSKSAKGKEKNFNHDSANHSRVRLNWSEMNLFFLFTLFSFWVQSFEIVISRFKLTSNTSNIRLLTIAKTEKCSKLLISLPAGILYLITIPDEIIETSWIFCYLFIYSKILTKLKWLNYL